MNTFSSQSESQQLQALHSPNLKIDTLLQNERKQNRQPPGALDLTKIEEKQKEEGDQFQQIDNTITPGGAETVEIFKRDEPDLKLTSPISVKGPSFLD